MGVLEAHNVTVVGSGQKTVVLGHGFGTDQSVWRHVVPNLVHEYKVVIYDNMGSGPTNPDNFDFERYATVEGYASDLICILEELQIQSCIFVGHSLSSMTGVVASIIHPNLFSKLILLSASPRFLNTEDYYGGFEQQDVDRLCNELELNYQSWCSRFAPLVVGDLDSVAVQEFSRTMFNMRPDIALSVFRMNFTFDLRLLLQRVTVPCHIIQSTKDLAVPVVISEYLHQKLGGKSVVEFMSACGHLPQLSSPEIIIPIVIRHIGYDIV